MSADQANLTEAKQRQRDEFNKRLLAALALKATKNAADSVDEVDGNHKNDNILVKIVKRKYSFIEQFDKSEAIQAQKIAEIDFVADLDKDDVIFIFLGTVYLGENSICSALS